MCCLQTTMRERYTLDGITHIHGDDEQKTLNKETTAEWDAQMRE